MCSGRPELRDSQDILNSETFRLIFVFVKKNSNANLKYKFLQTFRNHSQDFMRDVTKKFGFYTFHIILFCKIILF